MKFRLLFTVAALLALSSFAFGQPTGVVWYYYPGDGDCSSHSPITYGTPLPWYGIPIPDGAPINIKQYPSGTTVCSFAFNSADFCMETRPGFFFEWDGCERPVGDQIYCDVEYQNCHYWTAPYTVVLDVLDQYEIPLYEQDWYCHCQPPQPPETTLVFTEYCQWQSFFVPRGSSVQLSFEGDPANCGNCNVIEEQVDLLNICQWNWNVPGSLGYNPTRDNNPRYLHAGPNSTGVFMIHNDDGSFTVTIRPISVRQTSPSNRQDYAGFSEGGRSESSEEFGPWTDSVVTVTEQDSLNLYTLPKILGAGGVQQLVVNFDISQQNYWWSGMKFWAKLIAAAPGTAIRVECTQAQISDDTLYASGPGEYAVWLGPIWGTGNHILTLTALSGSAEFDCWALRTTIPTDSLPPVRDLVVWGNGNDIVLSWTVPTFAEAYAIYVSEIGPDGPWSLLDTTADTTYTHVGAAATYEKLFYSVTANKP